MSPTKNIFIFLFLFLGMVNCFAQVTKSKRSAKFKKIKIRHHKAVIICPSSKRKSNISAFHSLGLKFGDPFAIAYKYSFNRNYAIAVDFGKSASGLYSKYYRKILDVYLPDSLNSDQGLKYLSHKISLNYFVELKVLHQFPASIIAEGLRLYTGAGFQFRSASIKYEYEFVDSHSVENNGKIGDFNRNRSAHGLVIIAGFEYLYPKLPLSTFLEVEYFQDLSPTAKNNRLQGGIGIRYDF